MELSDAGQREARWYRRHAWALALVSLGLLHGCGSEEGPPTAPVVTTAGQRVALALPAFRAAADRTSWDPPGARIERVRAALAAGDTDSAEALLGRLLERTPEQAAEQAAEHFEALLLRSQLQYSRAEMAAALPGFESVLASGPTFRGAEIVFYYYGGCLQRLGDGPGARAALDAHLELAPGSGETLHALGELELQEGNADAALERFRQALDAHAGAVAGTRARAEAGVARALLSSGEVEAAAEALDRSLALDPGEPQSHYLRSRILARLGDRVGARHAVVDFRRLEAGHEVRYYGREDEAAGAEADE